MVRSWRPWRTETRRRAGGTQPPRGNKGGDKVNCRSAERVKVKWIVMEEKGGKGKLKREGKQKVTELLPLPDLNVMTLMSGNNEQRKWHNTYI